MSYSIALAMKILCPLKPLMSPRGPRLSLYHTSVITAPLIAVFLLYIRTLSPRIIAAQLSNTLPSIGPRYSQNSGIQKDNS